jgi:hypothetical protein
MKESLAKGDRRRESLRKDRIEHYGSQQFNGDRDPEYTPGKAAQVFISEQIYGFLEQETVTERDLSPNEEEKGCGERHVTEAADLNQRKHNALAKKSEIECRILDDQAGDT